MRNFHFTVDHDHSDDEGTRCASDQVCAFNIYIIFYVSIKGEDLPLSSICRP